MTNTNATHNKITSLGLTVQDIINMPTIDNGNGVYWVSDDNQTWTIHVDVDNNYTPYAITLAGTMDTVFITVDNNGLASDKYVIG